MRQLKKVIYTLNVGGYAPDITRLTYPFIEKYAGKIGAEFRVISERRYPEFPIVYEKLQIHELGQDNDWNIYIDSDALVHPETIDFTLFLNKDTVAHNGSDFAPIRWRYDQYMIRDGRHIGSCNWMTIASDWCLDLWTPLDIPLEEAVAYITPVMGEVHSGVIAPDHLIDDYTLSRNIARYGLKFKTLMDIQKEIGLLEANFFYHIYTETIEKKAELIAGVIEKWGI